MPPAAMTSVEGNETVAMEKVTIAILQQAIDLVLTLHDHQYSHPSKIMPAGTIGKHIRLAFFFFFFLIFLTRVNIDMCMIILTCYISHVMIQAT